MGALEDSDVISKVYDHIRAHFFQISKDTSKVDHIQEFFKRQKDILDKLPEVRNYSDARSAIPEVLAGMQKPQTVDYIGDVFSKYVMKSSLPITCQEDRCYCVFEDRGGHRNYADSKVQDILKILQKCETFQRTEI